MDDDSSRNSLEQPGDQRSADVPISVKIETSDNTQEKRDNATQGQIADLEDRIKSAEKWMICFTGAIALFGLCSVIVGVLQWSAIKGGSADTHNLAIAAQSQARNLGTVSSAADKIRQAAQDMVTQDRRIADNAKAALDTSNAQNQRALNTNIASSQLDQRAWLYTTGFVLSEEPSENEEVSMTTHVFNSGKTPALDVTSNSATYAGSGEPPEFKWPEINKPPSRNIIAPNDPAQSLTSIGIRLNGAGLDAYNRGKIAIHVLFRLDYDDIFGRPHWLTTCVYHVHGMPLDKVNYCGTGNDTDGRKRPN